MRRYYLYIVATLLSFSMTVHAQSPCDNVSVEAFEQLPQSGPHNYFGVRVSISQPYFENITVTGYIWDGPEEHGYNENHPYTLTIYAGYTTAETASNFYETGPAAEGAASISSVSTCPPAYAEATVATYNLSNQTYTINISPSNEDLLSAFQEMFSLEDPVIDSLKINDDDPSTLDSASYLVAYITADNRKFSFGVSLDKVSGSNQIIYNVNNSMISAARAWECKRNSTCNSCVPRRNWFLGPVRGCDCGNALDNDCIFNTSGSGFPWGPVIGLLGVIIAIIW